MNPLFPKALLINRNVICHVDLRIDIGRNQYEKYEKANQALRVYIAKDKTIKQYNEEDAEKSLEKGGLMHQQIVTINTALESIIGKKCSNFDACLRLQVFFHPEEDFYSVILCYNYDARLLSIHDLRILFPCSEIIMDSDIRAFFIHNFKAHEPMGAIDRDHCNDAPFLDLENVGLSKFLGKNVTVVEKAGRRSSRRSKQTSSESDDVNYKVVEQLKAMRDGDENFAPLSVYELMTMSADDIRKADMKYFTSITQGKMYQVIKEDQAEKAKASKKEKSDSPQDNQSENNGEIKETTPNNEGGK